MSGRPAAMLAWCRDIFGPVALETGERACRFIEEAIELGQAAGVPAETLARIAERVYSRDPGEFRKEVGQAAITLELLAHNVGLSIDAEADREFARVQSIPKEEWTRRHNAKVALGIASNSLATAGKFWWPSSTFSIPADNLCWHIPPSPDADFRCVRERGHRGRHEYRWSPVLKDHSHKAAT